MKKSIFYFSFLFLLATPFSGKAQLYADESPVPYFRYSATAGIGLTSLAGDLGIRNYKPAGFIRGNYFFFHGFSVGLEYQSGLLNAEDSGRQTLEPNVLYLGDYISLADPAVPRSARNYYHAVSLDARFQPVKFFQNDYIRRAEYREDYMRRVFNSVYVGVGVGIIHNRLHKSPRPQVFQVPLDALGEPIIDVSDPSAVQTYLVNTLFPSNPDVYQDPQYLPYTPAEYQGSDAGFSYFLTTNFGLEFPLHSLRPNGLDSYIWNLVLNGQLNFAFDDHLDGYSGGYMTNTSNDAFGFVSIGVNLRF